MFALVIGTVVVSGAALAAQRVELMFNVPKGLDSYTGKQPVTFGVPFAQGVLKVSDGLQIVRADGSAAPGQFEVTATWTPVGKQVRWLLIDAVAEIRNGKAQPLSLQFGPDVTTQTKSAFTIEKSKDVVKVDTGAHQFVVTRNGGNLGSFLLNCGKSVNYGMRVKSIELERDGPVRAVIKIAGHYETTKEGAIAEFVTRLRMYADCSFARVYHTMTWLTDDKTPINSLSFDIAHRVDDAEISSAVDGGRIVPTSWDNISLKQTDWNRVVGTGQGQHIDGWIEAVGADDAVFAALRWPWQQFPMGVTGSERSGKISIQLLSPDGPLSLKPKDIAVEGVMANVDVWNLRVFREGVPGTDMVANGTEAFPLVTPRGMAKTWEMLLWYGQPDIAAEVKNILTQEPVLGYADPQFAVKAELPSPAAPYDPQTFPEIEDGLKRAFDWYTLSEADYGDFGWLNWGDIQWAWTSRGVPIYRYWMNHGKGWSITPWALWLRSGDRRYWTHGQINSRHCMDLDMCHVPEHGRTEGDYRLRGGQNHYSALHWGYGPKVFTFFIDSEYLPYYWYITGDERGHDVMLEHAESMATWESREGWMANFKENPQEKIGRHLYVNLKNVGALYEATWDKRLKELLDECVALMEAGQFYDGNMPHVKTNHYMDQALAVGLRIYGWERMAPLIEGWHKVQGDPIRPGPTGNMGGPMSLWLAAILSEKTGDQHYLDVATKLARTQVAVMVDGPTKWNGLNPIPAHEAGPALRDYPILMAALKKLPANKRAAGYLPMAGFHSRVRLKDDEKTEGWSERQHIAMTLEQSDQSIHLNMTWLQTVSNFRVIIEAPNGKVVRDEVIERPRRTVSWQHFPISMEIPRDGVIGVYVIRLLVPGHKEYTPSVSIRSSTGKLVHWVGGGQCTLTPAQKAGQFWVKPIAGESVRVHYIVGPQVVGRNVLLNPAGEIVATSKVTQSITAPPTRNPRRFAASLPWGPILKYQSDKYEEGLYAVLFASDGDWHKFTELHGIEPFVSATKEQWFDPTQYSDHDLSRFR